MYTCTHILMYIHVCLYTYLYIYVYISLHVPLERVDPQSQCQFERTCWKASADKFLTPSDKNLGQLSTPARHALLRPCCNILWKVFVLDCSATALGRRLYTYILPKAERSMAADWHPSMGSSSWFACRAPLARKFRGNREQPNGNKSNKEGGACLKAILCRKPSMAMSRRAANGAR